ncbi:MAG: M56 family metallopeptidase, partial [Candidatus Hydrogenedentota bacterium]
MNDLTPLANQTVEIISKLSIHASLVLVVVLVLQIALGKKLSARWRYAMWGIVVARLLVPWNYDVPVITETVYAPKAEIAALAPSDSVPAVVKKLIVEQPFAQPITQLPTTETIAEAAAPVQMPLTVDSAAQVEPATSSTPKEAFQLPNIWTIAFAVWLLAAILIPGTILVNHLRMIRRALAASNNPPSWVLDTLDQARSEIGLTICPTIRVTSEIHAPTLVGAIRPKILLPKNLIEDSSSEEMRLFLLHELTHLKTGDIWFSWLWCIALSLHWFNPLMWWVGTRIRRDRELACDESVLRQIGDSAKGDYAHALLKAMEHVSGKTRQRYRFGLAGIAENKSEMQRRVESILAPIIRSKRLRLASALVLTGILCASFVQLIPTTKFVGAQDSGNTATFDASEFMRSVEVEMNRIKERYASGHAYKDKSDLTRAYTELKQRIPNPKEDDLQKMLTDLEDYSEAHENDEVYVWRIFHLMSLIALDTKDDIVIGDDPPSVVYLWEAMLHYPNARYSAPSKHSKFQHLVNEMAMIIWDTKGLDAAEKYVVEAWKTDRRFMHFHDWPWAQRMGKEDRSLDRLDRLRTQLSEKAPTPLKKVEFLLTPEGLRFGGVPISSDDELKRMLSTIEDPYDHFIAMGISTEDISLKQFRESQEKLMRLVQELKYDHFSDIGLQRSGTPSIPQSLRVGSAQLRAQCANNLKQIGLSMKMFSNESRGERFPSPSGLMMNIEVFFPEYLADSSILMCPADDPTPDGSISKDDLPQWYFDHSNYWYLAHAMTNEEQGLAHINAYSEILVEGDGNLDIDFDAPNLTPNKIFRTREGIERLFLTDLNDPDQGPQIQSTIPILIDRPGTHDPEGGNVLFLDGHVEYIRYPGKFPMTEAFIEGLESLDSLYERRIARANAPNESSIAIATTGEVIFQGKYEHRSGGRAYPALFELTLSRSAVGAITATSRIPHSGSTYIAIGDKTHHIVGYEFSNPQGNDGPGYKQTLVIEDGKVSRTQRGIREDEDNREISVPS